MVEVKNEGIEINGTVIDWVSGETKTIGHRLQHIKNIMKHCSEGDLSQAETILDDCDTIITAAKQIKADISDGLDN